MKSTIVTGYVRIPDHPRSADEYHRLAANLRRVGAPTRTFMSEVGRCWLSTFVRDKTITHAVDDNPRKNTLDYHIVQHQKTAWLATAAEFGPAADVLVWMDYGIFHQPGITVDVIDEFLRRIEAADKIDEICIPGAWERSSGYADSPDWRFCGSSMIMPRAHARTFHEAVKDVTLSRLAATNHVTWEVNDWAVVESLKVLPIRWYKADHNQTQFTNWRHRVA